jgi:hypothetical protein
MKISRLPPGVLVALVFGGVILLGLLLGYAIKDVPTEREACAKNCSAIHRSSRLAPIYPPAQKQLKGSERIEKINREQARFSV